MARWGAAEQNQAGHRPAFIYGASSVLQYNDWPHAELEPDDYLKPWELLRKTVSLQLWISSLKLFEAWQGLSQPILNLTQGLNRPRRSLHLLWAWLGANCHCAELKQKGTTKTKCIQITWKKNTEVRWPEAAELWFRAAHLCPCSSAQPCAQRTCVPASAVCYCLLAFSCSLKAPLSSHVALSGVL